MMPDLIAKLARKFQELSHQSSGAGDGVPALASLSRGYRASVVDNTAIKDMCIVQKDWHDIYILNLEVLRELRSRGDWVAQMTKQGRLSSPALVTWLMKLIQAPETTTTEDTRPNAMTSAED